MGPLFFFLLVFALKPSCAEGEETNIVEIWNAKKQDSSYEEWENYVTTCPIQEICPKDSKECTRDKVQWKDMEIQLQNSTEIVIMNDQTYEEATVNYTLKQNDIDELMGYICDLTLIQKHAEGCLILWIANQCPWDEITDDEAYEDTKDCEVKTIGEEDPRFAPDSCAGGAGWKGKWEGTTVEGDSYKINWASLVKEHACVESITLMDEKANLRKKFTTTWSDKTFPIEYKNTTCALTIKIDVWIKTSNDPDTANIPEADRAAAAVIPRCFLTKISDKVKCTVASPLSEPDIEDSNSDNSAKTKNIAIICGTITLVVILVIAARIYISRRQRVAEAKEKPNEELNDLYGTYYQGPEYNTATEDNPRYNEDGGNDDAVVIDENTFYDEPKGNDGMGSNGPTSPNGNIYHQI